MIKLNSQLYAVDTHKDLRRVEKILKNLKKK
jgi:GTP:adenosylcobinamide-phosphate guanylyltransferase